jgi:DNA-binding transcriptional ArsR family regulator
MQRCLDCARQRSSGLYGAGSDRRAGRPSRHLDILSELPRLPFLQGALQRYNALLLRHAVVSVGCNRFHSHQQRLARWLKAHWDRTGLDTFPFTTEFLSAQVGLDRDTVGELLKELTRQGLVTKAHRMVTITDHDGLTAACCECFAVCKEATGQYVSGLQELAHTHSGEERKSTGYSFAKPM